MRATFVVAFAAVILSALAFGSVFVQGAQGRRDADGMGARVQALEGREGIRTLWAEYGRTLDARDFRAFAQLFARDAEFVGGPG